MAENKFQVGDRVVIEENGEYYEAQVTSAQEPCEDKHWMWTYGIYITDNDYDDSRRPRDTFWRYEGQIERTG